MLFKLFFIFQTLFIFPIANILALFIPGLKKRRDFEKANLKLTVDKSWQADIAFEVSSEGEFEQVISLCEIYLTQNKKIELIFCSESALEVVTKWAQDKQAQVRVMRLPLITNIPFGKNRSILTFLTAKTLVLCRYDFFPELLYYGIYRAEKFVLLDATLIHKFEKVKNRKSFTRTIYNQFDLIVTSTQNDITRISSAFAINKERLDCFNFRSLRIINRINRATVKLEAFTSFALFLEFMQKFEYKNRIILGNFYPEEAPLVSQLKDSGLFCLVVPHKINAENDFASVLPSMKKYTINFSMSIRDMEKILSEYEKEPGLLILKQKGVLCELFHYFSVAYVGGGFFGSIHSVLEPHLSGCFVVCGPNIFRSTEFELAKNYDDSCVRSVAKMEDFFPVVVDHIKNFKTSKDLQKSFKEQQYEALRLSSKILKT